MRSTCAQYVLGDVLAMLLPNHQRWHAKWKLSRNTTYTLHASFCTFGADLHAQSVLSNKISAFGAQSEVCQECVVGWVGADGHV